MVTPCWLMGNFWGDREFIWRGVSRVDHIEDIYGLVDLGLGREKGVGVLVGRLTFCLGHLVLGKEGIREVI